MNNHNDKSVGESTRNVKGAAIKLLAAWIVLPSFFLVTGGAFDWWQAWAYCAILLVPMTVFVVSMIKNDPDFIARRLKMKEKEQRQRCILILAYPSFLAAIVIPGLDHRFGWSELPVAAVIAALAICLGGYLFVLRVFLENRWAGRTIETFEKQEVITTGPYAVVRHPMYTGTIALYVATPIALGSWWAILPALTFIPIFVFRILNEEEVLLRDLAGYDEYRKRVRYRLMPLIW